MTAQPFFFDTMLVEVKQGATTLTVGVLQSVEIIPEVEAVELYGSDSIKRADVIRRKLAVAVKAKVCKFHPNLIGYWQGTRNADKDIDGAVATGRTQGQVTDSNTMVLFQLTGTVVGKDGVTYKARATNVYFPKMNFGGSAGEWVALELDGKGDDFITEYTTT